MQDLDKQLEGMKQDLTGLQVWNPDSTSYYQADGADPYAYADGKHKADSFFNVDGDSKDLKTKIDEAIGKRVALQQALVDAQANYDEANGRNCPNPCKGQCHPNCWSKDRDKKKYSADRTTAAWNIKANEANIVKYQGELTARLAVEAAEGAESIKQKEAESKRTSRDILAKQGLTPEAIEAKLAAEGKSKGRNKMLLIAGSLILIAGFGFIFLRRRNG
jgi:hypothetical protein